METSGCHQSVVLSSDHVQVFDVHGGELLNSLQGGHCYDVTAVVYNSEMGEIYTGGDDGQILAWSPGLRVCPMGCRQ